MKKEDLINNYLSKKEYLPNDPSPEDLISYLHLNLKKKRLLKKFLKKPNRYLKRLPKKIRQEYLCKLFTKPIKQIVFDITNRESFARKLFKVEELKIDQI